MLEILLVVAAIGILAGIVIVAINPGKQLGATKNAQRMSNVNTILNAVYQYAIDNAGTLPTTITASDAEICVTGTLPATCVTDSFIDLSVLTANEEYLTAIPTDPTGATVTGTGYTIKATGNGRVTVSAPSAEGGATITVTR